MGAPMAYYCAMIQPTPALSAADHQWCRTADTADLVQRLMGEIPDCPEPSVLHLKILGRLVGLGHTQELNKIFSATCQTSDEPLLEWHRAICRQTQEWGRANRRIFSRHMQHAMVAAAIKNRWSCATYHVMLLNVRPYVLDADLIMRMMCHSEAGYFAQAVKTGVVSMADLVDAFRFRSAEQNPTDRALQTLRSIGWVDPVIRALCVEPNGFIQSIPLWPHSDAAQETTPEFKILLAKVPASVLTYAPQSMLASLAQKVVLQAAALYHDGTYPTKKM